jgi:hypothetical protein
MFVGAVSGLVVLWCLVHWLGVPSASPLSLPINR